MPPIKKKRKRSSNADVDEVRSIITELDSLLEDFNDEEVEDIEYRIDALTTMIFEAGLLKKKKPRHLKFHTAIKYLDIRLSDRDTLVSDTETFEDLINGYGDEPSGEEKEEAKGILESIAQALKSALAAEFGVAI